MVDLFFNTRYTFESGNGEMEMGRCITSYHVAITTDEDESKNNQEIGFAKFDIINLSQGHEIGYSSITLFDHSQSLMELGFAIYNFDEEGFREEVLDFYQHDFNFYGCICHIDRIEILPTFRGMGLGKKVLKDIIHRFSHGTSLFVLKAFPLQQEVTISESLWRRKMKLDELEQNKKKAKQKLFKYYKSLGFVNILKDEYFFLNPILPNKKLDKIELF